MTDKATRRLLEDYGLGCLLLTLSKVSIKYSENINLDIFMVIHFIIYKYFLYMSQIKLLNILRLNFCVLKQGIDKEAFEALMPSSSILAKLLENEMLGIKMGFETKLRNYIISKEQEYFVRTTRLFCQAKQRIFLNQQMIYWTGKKISLPQQKHFVRPKKQFC